PARRQRACSERAAGGTKHNSAARAAAGPGMPPHPTNDGAAQKRARDVSFAVPPRRRRKTLHLTVRDVRVLETLVARRVDTLDALHELVFPTVSRKRALNRLGELVSAGFLDRRSVELPGYDGLQSVYFLTARARTALNLRSEMSHEWFATRKWKLDLSEPS